MSDSFQPRVLMLGMGWFPLSVGGLDRYYRSLLEAMPEAGGVTIGPRGNAPGRVTVVSGPDRPLIARVLAYRRAALRAGRGSDVLDAHFALYAAAALPFGRLRSKPLLFHFHGPWAEESVLAGDASRLAHSARGAIERRVLRRADAHVVLSAAFGRLLVERYRVSPWAVHVFPPGVDLDAFAPADRVRARTRLGLDPHGFVAVCARRLVPRMGIDELLSAWERLAPRLPEATLIVIGDGPLREAFSDRAARGALAGRVLIRGRVSDAELLDAYRAADVAIVPSVDFEGFGLVTLEAAACGTPSIVTDVGGLPEAIGGLDRTLVVAPGDDEALAARIEAAADGDLPSRAATRAHAEGFDWPSAASRHRELHRRLRSGERDARPRVVYLDHVARLSGGEIALLRLLPHLRGVNAHVILAEDGLFAKRLQQAGVSVEVLALAAAARDLRKDAVRVGGAALTQAPATLGYVARLALRLRQLKPDLVHTNSLKAGVYGGLAARLAGVPMVWHVRDRIAPDYLPGATIRLVQGLLRTLPAAVVTNSRATLQTLGPRDGGRPRLVIADTVLAPPRLPLAQSANGDGEIVFGMLGRIAPWKGQDLFLRAFADAFPHGGARAVLVGEPMFGEASYERSLARLANDLGVGERVELRGFREDVWSELRSIHALVHASLTPEPFGQVVLEGMAAGLPVIAPDAGGPASMIADRDTGLLFGMGEQAELARAMRELVADAPLRARLGGAARRAAERYHPDVAAGELERLYARILAS